MAFGGYDSLFGFLVVVVLLAGKVASSAPNKSASLNRSSFPTGFVFGTASSAYQYEGAVKEGGRGPSIWDTFTHKHPEKIKDHSNGDIAIDSYHRYKEDVRIINETGMDAYRFSLSWSRILPKGSLSGGVNKEGIKYYNNLIDELISHGIKPFVTLFHWDSPQTLEDKYNGFLSSNIVTDFLNYADICFREFGDRVKHWITLNEPTSFCGGYLTGSAAPGRCSSWAGNCSTGDSATEPYIVGHHLLLAHAAAVKLYREEYKEKVAEIQQRAVVMLNGSFDFLGLNYYTTYYAASAPQSNNGHVSILTDVRANVTAFRNGTAIGPQAASSWLFVHPKGIRDLLLYTKKRYDNPIIYITENGVSDIINRTLPLHEALEDNMRVDYHHDHLSWLYTAIREGVDVKGYFAWSLMDNFEWADGYTVKFGIHYVDFEGGLKRYPKKSAIWFKKFLKV